MFRKILIANRGEIACRVIRTARALGYRTVAVYSDADREAEHVRQADEAVPLGGSAPAQSYLSIERLLEAARRSGAEAVHPGYGFLSENAEFAEACAAAGLIFIGPPPEAIRLMGNKAAAKRRMIEANVPCVPGYQGAAQDDATLIAEAQRIGFPLMVKAAAGGGGRGMRLVEDPADLVAALAAARSEATTAFGSSELILERAILRPRHVEIQVFADRHGNVIHLGERDCSIQRRHQKVIEEAPSPAVTPALRERMGEVAVAAARAIGYVGAGTLEFLLAEDGSFYFMEMNTRLQVEHPVTEEITGQDLVAWQLQVAAGEPLPLAQHEIRWQGWAIEARLYAEDPYHGFLPQAGRLIAWDPPAGVRVEHGLRAGQEIPPFYDPMIAKLVAHGRTREEARRRLLHALEDCVALGVNTNRSFLAACLDHPEFAAGRTSTAFIDTHFPPQELTPPPPPPVSVALAAVLAFRRMEEGVVPSLREWRSTAPVPVPLKLARGERRHELTLTVCAPDRYRAVSREGEWTLEILEAQDGRVVFMADGVRRQARYVFDETRVFLQQGGGEWCFEDVTLVSTRAAEHEGEARVTAPMNGAVVAVFVEAGQQVRRGERLLVLEAMKMEHEITAPRDGRILRLTVAPGKQVKQRELLIELEPAS